MVHRDFPLIIFFEIRINFFGNVLPVRMLITLFTIDMHAFII